MAYGFVPTFSGCLPKRLLLAFEETLQHISDVLQQVKPIRDLDRLWRTLTGTLGVIWRAIPRDDFDARMVLEPLFQSGRRAVWQQVDRTMTFEVDEDRAILLTFAYGIVVDTENPRRGHGHHRPAASTQQGVSADRDGEVVEDALTHFGADLESYMPLQLGQPTGATSAGQCQVGQSFTEDLAGAGGIAAEETANVETEVNG